MNVGPFSVTAGETRENLCDQFVQGKRLVFLCTHFITSTPHTMIFIGHRGRSLFSPLDCYSIPPRKTHLLTLTHWLPLASPPATIRPRFGFGLGCSQSSKMRMLPRKNYFYLQMSSSVGSEIKMDTTRRNVTQLNSQCCAANLK